jgi:hypothetical protein
MADHVTGPQRQKCTAFSGSGRYCSRYCAKVPTWTLVGALAATGVAPSMHLDYINQLAWTHAGQELVLLACSPHLLVLRTFAIAPAWG